MNWGALAPALGTLAGAGLAIGTGGAALPAEAAIMGVPASTVGGGAAIGGALGTVGGQLAPKDMPPPAGAPPGAHPAMPNTMQQPSLAQQLQANLTPGQGGFLKHPFV